MYAPTPMRVRARRTQADHRRLDRPRTAPGCRTSKTRGMALVWPPPADAASLLRLRRDAGIRSSLVRSLPMHERRRNWLVVQLVPGLLGATVFAVLLYVIFDTSLLAAALYGIFFAAITASARLLWWWLGARSRRGTSAML